MINTDLCDWIVKSKSDMYMIKVFPKTARVGEPELMVTFLRNVYPKYYQIIQPRLSRTSSNLYYYYSDYYHYEDDWHLGLYSNASEV